MGVLLLYHIPTFRSTRPLWLYYELEALYKDRSERIGFPSLRIRKLDIETFRTNKPADLMALNPNGKIPVLVDGDVTMFDSNAILNYILDCYDCDKILSPKDRGKVHECEREAARAKKNTWLEPFIPC